jgi:hypothetical protein
MRTKTEHLSMLGAPPLLQQTEKLTVGKLRCPPALHRTWLAAARVSRANLREESLVATKPIALSLVCERKCPNRLWKGGTESVGTHILKTILIPKVVLSNFPSALILQFPTGSMDGMDKT